MYSKKLIAGDSPKKYSKILLVGAKRKKCRKIVMVGENKMTQSPMLLTLTLGVKTKKRSQTPLLGACKTKLKTRIQRRARRNRTKMAGGRRLKRKSLYQMRKRRWR